MGATTDRAEYNHSFPPPVYWQGKLGRERGGGRKRGAYDPTFWEISIVVVVVVEISMANDDHDLPKCSTKRHTLVVQKSPKEFCGHGLGGRGGFAAVVG